MPKHEHDYSPYKRVKRLVLQKCKECEVTKTHIILDFDEEKAKEVDEEIRRSING